MDEEDACSLCVGLLNVLIALVVLAVFVLPALQSLLAKAYNLAYTVITGVVLQLVSVPLKWLMGPRDDEGRRYHEYQVRFNAEQQRHAEVSAALRQYKGYEAYVARFVARFQAEELPLIDYEARVRRLAVPDSFKNLPLEEQLTAYHDNITLDTEETEHDAELVSIFIGAVAGSVIEQINSSKPREAKPCRLEYTGSMFEGTKVHKPDEFDIMIVIDGSQDLESENMTPGYARLRSSQFFGFHRFSHAFDEDRNMSPERMIDWFYGLVHRDVKKVSDFRWDPKVSLKISRHGPAITVKIEEEEDDGVQRRIAVDLVLCIQLDRNHYYVAKRYKEYADADQPSDRTLGCHPDMLWRRSFSVRETSTIACVECRRECLRVLKSIFTKRPALAKFTSYHLKTVLLHECRAQGNWQYERRAKRFMGMLERIERCLRDKRLPHFYLPDLNLLDGIRQETIDNMHGRVKRIIDSKHERDRVLYDT